MSKTYAIADLHGRIDLLETALAKIADHADLPATLIILGDYVDRGPDSRQVIERLMGGLDEDWRFICLKGNHEDIMWQTCCGIVPDCDWWLTNGGGATRKLARPKRFELLTPRFVVWCPAHQRDCPYQRVLSSR
jgi:serine/threonine protein phosphatase 1